MNPEFEYLEREQTDPHSTDPQEQALIDYQTKAQEITFTDDASVNVALFLIAKLKEYEKGQDEARRLQTDPLRAQIEEITKPFNERKAKAATERTKLQKRLDAYLDEKERQRQIEQQRLLAEAEAERVRREDEARKAREAAEAARANGNEVAATKLESKAQRHELLAATVAPPVLQAEPKTMELFDGSKVTQRQDWDWQFGNGLPRGVEYSRQDSRLKDIPDAYFILDETKIGKVVRSGVDIAGIKRIPKRVLATRKATA